MLADYTAAMAKKQSGKYLEAIAIFEMLFGDKRFRHDALIECALCYRGLNDFVKSDDLLKTAILEGSQSIWSRIHLSVNYRIQKHYPESLRLILAALDMEPRHKYALYEAAETYYMLGMYEACLTYLTQLLDVDNHSLEAYRLLTALNLRVNTLRDACSALSRQSDTGPDDLDACVLALANPDGERALGNNDYVYQNTVRLVQRINALSTLNAIDIDKLRPVNFSTVSAAVAAERSISLAEVDEQIFSAMAERTPLSVVRVADGEGALLAYLNNLQEVGAFPMEPSSILLGQFMWSVWFGSSLLEEEVERLVALRHALIRSISEASILCYTRFRATNPKTSYVSYHGNKYIANFCDALTTPCYPSSIVPEDLLVKTDFFSRLFTPGRKLSLITCHPSIAQKLSFIQVDIVQNIVIPLQQSHAELFNYPRSNKRHFPEVFDKTLAAIKVDCDLFLVAAGALGKIYCQAIKEQGGRAFDLGALADAFAGFNTRPTLWNKWQQNKLW